MYVCTDDDNTMAEIRFHCDFVNNGTRECYEEAGSANNEALEIHVRYT